MPFVGTCSVRDFGEGARLALDAFRVMAAGGDQSAIVEAFDARLGVLGRGALGALHILVREISAVGRRRVAVAFPGCPRMTADELSVLAMMSAAQRRDHPMVERHLVWILAGRDSETARSAATAIGGILSGAGLTISGPPVTLAATPRATNGLALRVSDGARSPSPCTDRAAADS